MDYTQILENRQAIIPAIEIPEKSRWTILLVDDEKIVRMITRKKLEQFGHRILEAQNGRQAFAILQEHPIDLVISDWMMPEMDGPSLCEAIKGEESLKSTYIIMMTALNQPQQIAEGLRRGADDFMPKTASDQEIGGRVNAGLRTRNLIRQVEASYQVIVKQQAEIDADLRSAAEFVSSLLPEQGLVGPDLELRWVYLPSSRLGGDLFQVAKWDDDHLGCMILDMSGHGIGPALRAVSLAKTFRPDMIQQRYPNFDPAEILKVLNFENPMNDSGDYFTAWIGCLDVRNRELRYATAGHPAAILSRLDQQAIRLGSKTWPIGFGIEGLYSTQKVDLEPGDRLYFFSDGIYEVESPDGQFWGRERLENACQQVQHKPMREALPWIIQQAMIWQKKEMFGDDVALVGLEIN